MTEAAGLKMISYEWVRGRFDVISCVEGEFEQAIALKIAFKNSDKKDSIYFIHLNHTNPALNKDSDEYKKVISTK